MAEPPSSEPESSSTSSSPSPEHGPANRGRDSSKHPVNRGVRMRTWEKRVSEIREDAVGNPTGSLDLRRLTSSWALTSPASKWVFTFCSGSPCFATPRPGLARAGHPGRRRVRRWAAAVPQPLLFF
ncbi:uncharacterized protein J3R85_014679 [Psidium guajava]|nr:uncharacterized protein J3R85_014679 [Psidium guajava]